LLLLSLLFIAAACNVTKNLPPHEYLLIKNKFKINTPKVSEDELSGYIQQTPNKKLFGLFRANIACYNMGSKGKDTKFKKWLRTKAGTAPVLVDTNMATVSLKQMRLYLNNKGYFHSELRDSVVYKKKKAKVIYIIETSRPYTIRSITYSISDTQVARYVYQDTAKCLIKRRNNYDSYLFDSERTRITNGLMDHGFFRFSNTFIVYRIDSALRTREMDLRIEITNPVMPSLRNFGIVEETPHKRYFINKINIYPEFNLLQTDTTAYDTLIRKHPGSRHDTASSTYTFLFRSPMKIKPSTIGQSIFIKNGNQYNLSDVNQTYTQLSSLNVFKYINIQFRESPKSDSLHRNYLDGSIQLSRASVNSFSVSPDVTNSAGAPGLQGNISYSNKNVFKGAQMLKISFNAMAQAQGSIGNSSGQPFFNTLEFGVNGSLTFPQFLIPIRQEKLPKSFKPKTIFTIGYNFQKRPEYDRNLLNFSFGYSWVQNEKIRHLLDPVEILVVKAILDSAFAADLEDLHDKRYQNQYEDHIIAGLKYTITFNNQIVNKVKDFFYIRSNFETAGNLLYLSDVIFQGKKDADNYYTLFNIRYSQFVRPDLDVRFYHLFSKTKSMVYRFYGGIGFPYGNSYALPFEKAFFAGGANDIRGWRYGTLGPGSYHNDTLETYDQTGDMQFQVDLEYRFPVYKWFKSAFFLDAGNIWLRHESTDFPGGMFSFNTFMEQIAVDVGLGLRLDFDYFIFRLDPAVPIRVPYYPDNGHWYVQKLNWSDVIWNFGIGYPF
jgi:outer membrane protein assembly factor BamA